MRIVFGVFIILHGLVHLLYFGQSARYFELKPGMPWPDRSWTFSRLLTDVSIRNLASMALIMAAISLVASGTGILVGQVWWRPLIAGATIFSAKPVSSRPTHLRVTITVGKLDLFRLNQ
jgi:hypothetical protein